MSEPTARMTPSEHYRIGSWREYLETSTGPRVLDIDPLDPANTALVLVDLQRKMVDDTVESMFPPNGRPDANIDGTSARLGRIQTVVLPNVRRLLAEFRRRGRHVLHFAAGP